MFFDTELLDKNKPHVNKIKILTYQHFGNS